MQELVARHGALVFALARTIVRDDADAEEIAADAFMQAWRTAATFDAARSSVTSWLGVIARSRALDRRRALVRQGKYISQESESAPVSAAQEASSSPTPDRLAEQQEARALVAAALGALPDSQRAVIELAYFGGLSQSEIAARLAMPLGTVKTRTLAAMKLLRAQLGPLLRERLA